jgi:2-polyprenyl-3-methyl-5-hydroxy-6-metoxy-1,4-benzoquinol methylase
MIIRDFFEQDNIKIFDNDTEESHADYNAQGLDSLYAQEEKHFWFIARKEFILKNMRKYITKGEKIVEIGSGTGNVSRFLQKNEYRNISVGEMHLNGLKYAKGYGIKECYQFNLLDTPFEDEFDTICMFDVLEHIKEDSFALKNVNKSLRKQGKVVLTVPSHMWLWNRDDAIAGHKTRYTKKELIDKLKNNGFEILKARYFFISIIPLLFLRTILNRDSKLAVKETEFSNDISMNFLLNNALLLISRVENKINHLLPNIFGGSLLVVAKKNDRI